MILSAVNLVRNTTQAALQLILYSVPDPANIMVICWYTATKFPSQYSESC
jgi:hypothetical protein